MNSAPLAGPANGNVIGVSSGPAFPPPPLASHAHGSSSTHVPPLIDREDQSEVNVSVSKIPRILPHERVFPIQIGSELFKLSGASLSSDAPSYFSQYFLCQIKHAEESGEDACSVIRTLYIDRDAVTFRDIAQHLQGYHIAPRDGTHFVRLFADAQFYSLPKLISQLYEESIFISIGHREFKIPRNLLADPGNSPNYFSLGFAVFFSSPDNLFPGLDRDDLVRPPSILPPAVPGRSADNFEELLHLLRGYPLRIRDEDHRQALLQDCRYFHFKGLEQRLIPHRVAYNQARRRDEITLRIEDIMKSGISVVVDSPAMTAGGAAAVPSPAAAGGIPTPQGQQQGQQRPVSPGSFFAWVYYARPFLDTRPAELVLEIGGESTRLHFTPPPLAAPSASPAAPAVAGTVRAEFFGEKRKRVVRLLEVIATKLSLSTVKQPLGLLMATGGAESQPDSPGNTALCDEDYVRVAIVPETSIVLDGRPWPWPPFAAWREREREAADEMVASSSNGNSATTATAHLDSAAPGPSLLGRKRRRVDGGAGSAGGGGMGGMGGVGAVVAPGSEWTVKSGLWRLRIQGSGKGRSANGNSSGIECVLVAVKIDALSSEQARNASRGFLSG